MRYYPTTHAIERIIARFGVESDKAADWVNDKMKQARYVTQNGGGKTLVYENDNARFIIDGSNNAVITVHHATRLDFLRPTLDREIRKLRREYTAKIRQSERKLSEQYAKLAEQMANFANARNPNTRELIGERMATTESHIGGVKRSIERMKDEMQARIKAIEVISE